MAANETVTTSTGDLQLLIVDAESVDIPCADTDVTSVDMANEVVTVMHSFIS